jgi:hypothetical protein
VEEKVRMNYRQDHIKIIQFLAKDLPKRNSFKVSDIAKVFTDVSRRKPDTALDSDRAARNALRKPRKEGHVEIAERGEYRLTQQGATFAKKLEAYDVAPDCKADGEKLTKKAKGSKVEKKTAKVEKKVAKAEKKPAKPSKLEKNKTKVEKKAKAEKGEAKVEKKKGGGLRLPKSKKPENIAAAETEAEDMDTESAEEDASEPKRSVGSELSI